jgi:hypothetical protein
MPVVSVVEFSVPDQDMHPSGGHVWIDVEFESGRKVTLRLDEKDLNHPRHPRLYVSMDDEIGFDVLVGADR